MTEQNWLEISMLVDGELAEAVAEVMARYAPGGVAIESTAVTANPDDSEGHAVGPLKVYAFLPVDERLEETRHKLEEGLWFLGRIRELPAAQFRTVQETDWAEAWKQHYHPIEIGKLMVIVPAWLENPRPERVAVKIDPGMAFGTGTHPTTRLCLEWIEMILGEADHAALSAYDVLDVGCGTAILAVAALKLGARRALGVDIDPLAVRVAGENALVNGVADRLELATGSVAETVAGKFSLRQAPLVLANILAPVLIQLFGDGLAELVSPGGSLILSGILDTQAAGVIAAGEAKGLTLAGQLQELDWVAIRMTRPE
jgi:ribosomal protein L11 methyltransferase